MAFNTEPSGFDSAHAKTDLDSGARAQHHTLGVGINQAASGKSVALLEARIKALETRLATAGIP